MFDLFLFSEDSGTMFLRNVSRHLPNYTCHNIEDN
jgi:hypothetical protein